MSNAFTNFLGNVASGVFDSGADLKDYQHADRLFVKDTFARAPKFGFLYYVIFDINPLAIENNQWFQTGKPNVGLLVKKIDLPKFQISTETVNQYNRKTVIQTGIKYQPVSIEFHDDNSNITNNLWKNYYQYYYADSNYGSKNTDLIPSYGNTKFGTKDYSYGLDNFQVDPFFKKIDVYVLHRHNYTKFTLVNPIITDWTHDSVESDQGQKILTNRMSVAYENVLYDTDLSNKIKKNAKPEGFASTYYDKTPSPLSVGGKGTNTLFGPGGIISGADSVLGAFTDAKTPLDYLGAGLQAANLAKQASQLSKSGLRQEGYSILGGVLGSIQQTGNQPGGIRDQINGRNYGMNGALGSLVGTFQNATIDNTTTANIKKLPPGG